MAISTIRNSIDDVIALYRRDLDVGLIEANLRLTAERRIVQLQQLLQFADELRRAPDRDTASR